MTGISIAPARPLDAGTVGNIMTVANAELPWLPRVYSAAQDIKHSGEMIEAGWVYVARTNENALGFIARCKTEIHALYVLPQAQNRGIGSALLDSAKEQCSKLGLWSYEENTRAANFYGLHGFFETERLDGSTSEASLPHIRFEWKQREV